MPYILIRLRVYPSMIYKPHFNYENYNCENDKTIFISHPVEEKKCMESLMTNATNAVNSANVILVSYKNQKPHD